MWAEIMSGLEGRLIGDGRALFDELRDDGALHRVILEVENRSRINSRDACWYEADERFSWRDGRGSRCEWIGRGPIAVMPAPLDGTIGGLIHHGHDFQPIDGVVFFLKGAFQLGVVLIQRFTDDRIRPADQRLGKGPGAGGERTFAYVLLKEGCAGMAEGQAGGARRYIGFEAD